MHSPSAWAQEDFVDGGAPPLLKTAPSQPVRLKGDSGSAGISLDIVLPPLELAEKSALTVATKNQPLKIGIGRTLPASFQGDIGPYLTWMEAADGSLTAALTVSSPEAGALRLALKAERLPAGSEIRFFDFQEPMRVFGPFGTDAILPAPDEKLSTRKAQPVAAKTAHADDDLFWSPVIEGDRIGMEIQVTSAEAVADISISIPQISHLSVSVADIQDKSLGDIASAGACNIDVNCRFVSASSRAATAKIVFTQNGASYLCTGTLLQDKEVGWIPYFMTANHCVNTAAAAKTINSFWLFERASCDGPAPKSVIQFTRGAELLATKTDSDFSFLQLNDADIARTPGIQFAGWDAKKLEPYLTVRGIHHPQGDLKKWSEGMAIGFAGYGGEVDGRGSHVRVVWDHGTTEGGSSGSGLFDVVGRFRGNLHGGQASCSNLDAPDWYGRFDLTYPAVKRWLKLVAKPLRSGKEISSRVGKRKWKDYKIKVKRNQQLTVKLYRLSKDADLYVRKDSRPNKTGYPGSFDCRPYADGARQETCTLTNTADKTVTYFVGVYGYQSTPYALKATLR